MFFRAKWPYAPAAVTILAVVLGAVVHAEELDQVPWNVSKASGEVWVEIVGVQPAALSDKATLKAGDTIRTGRNGRVLLARGQESILIAPNSVIALPAKTTEGGTTIVQQAGSILLQVEKRNTRSFEVETPYLVAAVKGTKFRVSVAGATASVTVLEGQVQVANSQSGKFAMVLPGQTASTTTRDRGGLLLTGSGVLSPIQQGQPPATSVPHVPIPHGGLSAPAASEGRQVRALFEPHRSAVAVADGSGRSGGRSNALRINTALGEIKLDVHKATGGMARAAANLGAGSAQTVWSSGDITPGNGVGKSYNLGNNGSGNGLGSANGGSGGNGNSGGSGAAGGNGNGNAYGLNGGNGNGNAYGLDGGHGKGHGKGG